MKKKYIVITASILIIALIVACGWIFTVRNVSVVFYNKTGLADEATVIAASGLSARKNIFSIKEADIKAGVAAAFDDNSIVVTNVVRNFPNEVVIYVKERIPIFKISVWSSDGVERCVPTDKDFQRGNIVTEDEIDYLLIEVKGFQVYETFDVKECVNLRAMAGAFIACGINEEALPYFISSVEITDEYFNVKLRETSAVLKISVEDVTAQTAALYEKYLQLDEQSRYGAVLSY